MFNFLNDLSDRFKSTAYFLRSNEEVLESSIKAFQTTRMGIDPAALVNPYALGEMVAAAKLEIESKYSFTDVAAISKAVRINLYQKAQQGLITAFNPTKGERMNHPLLISDLSFDNHFYYQATDFAEEVVKVVREQKDKKLACLFLEKIHDILSGEDKPLDIGGLGLETIKVRKSYLARPEDLHPVQISNKLKGFTELMGKIRLA